MLLAENQADEVGCDEVGYADEAEGDELPEPPAGLTEVDFRGCRWISGEPTALRSGMFCCAPVVRGASWCPRHFAITFPKKSAARGGARR
jgi:hypothetical protein